MWNQDAELSHCVHLAVTTRVSFQTLIFAMFYMFLLRPTEFGQCCGCYCRTQEDVWPIIVCCIGHVLISIAVYILVGFSSLLGTINLGDDWNRDLFEHINASLCDPFAFVFLYVGRISRSIFKDIDLVGVIRLYPIFVLLFSLNDWISFVLSDTSLRNLLYPPLFENILLGVAIIELVIIIIIIDSNQKQFNIVKSMSQLHQPQVSPIPQKAHTQLKALIESIKQSPNSSDLKCIYEENIPHLKTIFKDFTNLQSSRELPFVASSPSYLAMDGENITFDKDNINPHKDRCSRLWFVFHPVLDVVKDIDIPLDEDYETDLCPLDVDILISCISFFSHLCCIPSQAIENITFDKDNINPHKDRCSRLWFVFHPVLDVVKDIDIPLDEDYETDLCPLDVDILISCISFFSHLCCIPSQAIEVCNNIKDGLLDGWLELAKRIKKYERNNNVIECLFKLISMFPAVPELIPYIAGKYDEIVEWYHSDDGSVNEMYEKYLTEVCASRYFIEHDSRLKKLSDDIETITKKSMDSDGPLNLYPEHIRIIEMLAKRNSYFIRLPLLTLIKPFLINMLKGPDYLDLFRGDYDLFSSNYLLGFFLIRIDDNNFL
ncbi:hypothetical protein ADUPG1_007848 [Aduncisulcus paluster]|uniref:Uncharacterized protein n=1 Tax=Aduncisulcus paluster TaxID=2918883 RepID=A0ABQ5KPQ7_9EUKA|nr:hypothetical protein ADUPG1_007848 [Aduncisulcus paluster]